MFTLAFICTDVETLPVNVAEDIASEMRHMNINAKMLNEIQRNFKDDSVSDFGILKVFLLP